MLRKLTTGVDVWYTWLERRRHRQRSSTTLTLNLPQTAWFVFLNQVKEIYPMMFSAVFLLPMFLPLISKWKVKAQPPGWSSGHVQLLKWFHTELDKHAVLYFALMKVTMIIWFWEGKIMENREMSMTELSIEQTGSVFQPSPNSGESSLIRLAT